MLSRCSAYRRPPPRRASAGPSYQRRRVRFQAPACLHWHSRSPPDGILRSRFHHALCFRSSLQLRSGRKEAKQTNPYST